MCCSHASFTEPDCSTVVSFTWLGCSGFATHAALSKPAYRLPPARPFVTTLRLSQSPSSPTLLPRPFFNDPVWVNLAFSRLPRRAALCPQLQPCASRADENAEYAYFAAFLNFLALRAPSIPAPRHPSMTMLIGSGTGTSV